MNTRFFSTLWLCLALAFGTSSAMAQTEGHYYKKAADLFLEAYNQEEFHRIFDAFAPIMKNALPSEEATAFLSRLKGQTGPIKSMTFDRYEQTFGVYKTAFEAGFLAVNLSVDAQGQINGFSVEPFVEAPKHAAFDRNQTDLILPFEGRWLVFWGGDTMEDNYHIEDPAQSGAFDFVIVDNQSKSFRSDGQSNEDYYCFDQPILAPCAGTVVMAVDGVKDNKPGQMNRMLALGNTVVLRTDSDEYLVFAHFKKHSVQVREGERVQAGQHLGRCGNSGNSSEPHLHFHIQNQEMMDGAVGAKSYFKSIDVNGERRTDHSPVRGDVVGN